MQAFSPRAQFQGGNNPQGGFPRQIMNDGMRLTFQPNRASPDGVNHQSPIQGNQRQHSIMSPDAME